jgi:replicative DNA helicase
MKTLKPVMYRNIASILCSDNNNFRSSQNLLLFSKVLSTYPAKSEYYQVAHRMMSFYEKNVFKVSLILEIMRDEGEDEEIINIVDQLNREPTIKTQAEVLRLCKVLADYVKWAKMIQKKNSFASALDMMDAEDESNIKNVVETMYKLSTEMISAYNVINISEVSNVFDTCDKDAMKTVIADAKDARDPNRGIITGIRGLNSLLSPAYLGGCLYVYQGLPGNYKSGILLKGHVDTLKYNQHLKESLNGKTGISMYISMENTMTQTVRRLWSLLYPSADMSMFSVDEISEMMDQALTENEMRSVVLYYGYREKSTADIANIIRTYNRDDTEVVALFFDYIKRVRPARTDAAATASEKSELNAIMNEFKLMAAQFNIPIVTGHQLNREAAKMVDEVVRNGGYNKTDSVLSRSQTGSAWEIMEVADFVAVINIENSNETKMLVIKAVKQRDLDGQTDSNITAIRHPFLSPQSFALKDDILENVSLSIPIYQGIQKTNYMATI